MNKDLIIFEKDGINVGIKSGELNDELIKVLELHGFKRLEGLYEQKECTAIFDKEHMIFYSKVLQEEYIRAKDMTNLSKQIAAMKEDVYTLEEYKTPNRLKNAKYEDARREPKINRNEPCRCGSGKKFKKCCL